MCPESEVTLACKYIHEAVNADQFGLIREALCAYKNALHIFNSCPEETLKEVGILIDGTSDEANELIHNASNRVLELEALAFKLTPNSKALGKIVTEHLAGEDNALSTEWDCPTPTVSTISRDKTGEICKLEVDVERGGYGCGDVSKLESPFACAPAGIDSVSPCCEPKVSHVSTISFSERGSSCASFLLEPDICMTPKLDCTKYYFENNDTRSTVTQEDVEDMHLIIKNLDSGEVLQLSRNNTKGATTSRNKTGIDTTITRMATSISSVAGPPLPKKREVKTNTTLLKRMVRNLDTNEVKLLKTEAPMAKAPSKFRLW